MRKSNFFNKWLGNISVVVIVLLCGTVSLHAASDVRVTIKRPVIPILSHKKYNPAIRLDIKGKTDFIINALEFSTNGTIYPDDIVNISIYGSDDKGYIDTTRVIASSQFVSEEIIFRNKIQSSGDSIALWVSIVLKDEIHLNNHIVINCTKLRTDKGKALIIDSTPNEWLRPGVAVRQQGQDGVVSSRIPGLETAKDGTLLAIYDARWDIARDLQGNIDIALQRSFDKGVTWQPMQIIMDMGEWGELPQKFNGVSDACILVDDTSGDLYVAGLWMHGILDKQTGKWTEGLKETSENWIHQWHEKGSQPGTDVKQTSQFLIVKSTDNGKTWSSPVNITQQTKRPEWWLYAPAPGHGVTLQDGTLVFPTQGRDENGVPFSNITWSKDHGKTWHASNPAYKDVTECMAVELSNGDVMLNMRDNRNKKNQVENGRRICITSDLGNTWTEHPTSRKAFIEPTCMGSIHRHTYHKDGEKKTILLFCNPSSKIRRDKITLKASLNDGKTWPEKQTILLDEYRGWGYSCITSVDENTIGILYESSQSQLVYQQVNLNELIRK